MTADNEPIDAEIVPDEQPSIPPTQTPGYTEDGVPTFDYVQHRVESMGAKNELDAATPAAQNAQFDFEQTKRAGKDKLEEIRRSMRGE